MSEDTKKSPEGSRIYEFSQSARSPAKRAAVIFVTCIAEKWEMVYRFPGDKGGMKTESCHNEVNASLKLEAAAKENGSVLPVSGMMAYINPEHCQRFISIIGTDGKPPYVVLRGHENESLMTLPFPEEASRTYLSREEFLSELNELLKTDGEKKPGVILQGRWSQPV